MPVTPMPTDRRAINRANAERAKDGFWSVPDRSATLAVLWSDGEFANDIASAIGEGCTKNMVIRRAKVLGLPARKGWCRFGSARRAHPIRVPCETNEGRAA